MKKYVITALVIFFIPFFAVFSAAEEAEDEMTQNLIDASGIVKAADALDEETKKLLKDIGFEDILPQSFFEIDAQSVLFASIGSLKSTATEMIKLLCLLSAGMIMAALLESMNEGLSKMQNKRIFSYVLALFILSVCISPLSQILGAAEGAIQTAAVFCNTVFPVLCAVLTAQGRIMTAAVFNGGALAVSEIVLLLFTRLFLPLLHILLALGVIGSIETQTGVEQLVKLFRKIISIGLSIGAGIYFTLLGVKGGIASAADETTLKTLKLAAGNFVPIIGSAISDSAASVVSGLSLTKSTIGSFGMLALMSIFVPLLLKLLLWNVCFETAAFIGDSFGMKQVMNIFKNLAGSVSIFAVICLFCALIFVGNTALFLGARGSV